MYYYLGKGCCKSLCMAHVHKQKWFKLSKKILGKLPANNQQMVVNLGR